MNYSSTDLDLVFNRYWIINGEVFYYNTLPNPEQTITNKAKAIAKRFFQERK